MKIGDVKNIKTAKKYSNALIESAAADNKLDRVCNDLIFADETIRSNTQLCDFLNNPLIKNADKKDVIEKLFKIHIDTITLDFLYILIDNDRIDILHEILNQFSVSYNKVNNIIKPFVISAVELDEEQKTRLVDKLEKKLLKKVQPDYQIDSNIIGGLIIEIDDRTIDCSLKTKFENVKKQLAKGNKYGSD